jgi:dTDP-4-amino-4,6-dideoxygalactose transaminase
VRSSYHLYPVLIDFAALGVSRSDLMDRLRDLGIGTQVHYIPLPAQPYYRDRGWQPEDFPGAARYYERTLSLPMFPAMADADVDRVVASLQQALAELGGR